MDIFCDVFYYGLVHTDRSPYPQQQATNKE
jgi:hypothetical protein